MKEVVAFLSGIIVGGAAAILLAPESGEETRKKLNKQAKKLRKDLEEQTNKGVELMKEARELGEERLREFRENSQEFVENAAKKLNTNGSVTSDIDGI